ncbi:MAG: winged helix-turn-helix transcriptional regulator [Methanomassiliicoccales archaeon]|nr:MAG: winged helix-turn-helix transcriptional regulator [Methanomassiliicoccales archaeon]
MCELKKKLPDNEHLSNQAKLFQAMSDPKRLQILHALMRTDLCPCVLKDITGLSDSKLSYHLNILEGEGLIESSPRHRWRIYFITEKGRKELGK